MQELTLEDFKERLKEWMKDKEEFTDYDLWEAFPELKGDNYDMYWEAASDVIEGYFTIEEIPDPENPKYTIAKYVRVFEQKPIIELSRFASEVIYDVEKFREKLQSFMEELGFSYAYVGRFGTKVRINLRHST